MAKLNLDSVITSNDRYNGKRVSDVIKTSKKGTIFQLIKKGYEFDDDVLKECNITKTVRDRRANFVISEHEKDTKVYKKDTATMKEILKEINTLEYDGYEEKETPKMEETEDEFETTTTEE